MQKAATNKLVLLLLVLFISALFLSTQCWDRIWHPNKIVGARRASQQKLEGIYE